MNTKKQLRRTAAAGTAIMLIAVPAAAQAQDSTGIEKQAMLGNVTVTARRTTMRGSGAENLTSMFRGELFKAACCNLGESFTNNPSVDVNYSDAATGARQIRLLGLAGTYVQMLTENLPDFRGAALPYGLGYVPGSWMKSIQVSKGNSSVKNGYEAMTGQINVEYLKPEDETGATVNIYGNTMERLEADAEGNIHIGGSKNLSTEILGHFENNWSHHDGNDDGFQDAPNIRQYNLMNRWYWTTGHYMFHGGLSLINEHRAFGQTAMHAGGTMPATAADELWKGYVDTQRYTAYMKHAYMFGDRANSNIALMGNVTMHEQQAAYGRRTYDVNEKSAYASLMFETTPGEHNISAGLSWNYDFLHEHAAGERIVWRQGSTLLPYATFDGGRTSETVPGAYLQYTYNHNGRFIGMAGLRVDHSNVYGTFVTPRAHIKWVVSDWLTLRASAGKGYRTPHALAENNNLLASGKWIAIDRLRQERAWNYGAAANMHLPLFGRTVTLNTEYYYTRFSEQALVDYDEDAMTISIHNLDGRSYSHTLQADATCELFRGFDISAAYRYNIVRATYGGRLLWKPLQSRYKALMSMSWRPDPGLWQFDMTFALNGGGRLPQADGRETSFHAYPTLNMQVKRSFRHFDIYVGGENLTNYRQKNPVIAAAEPWSTAFDATQTYAPLTGAMGYASIRINLGNRL